MLSHVISAVNFESFEYVTDRREPEATYIEGNPTRQSQATVLAGNAQRTQDLVFPVTVKLNAKNQSGDGQSYLLQPGMAVSIEAKIGQRRIIEYLLSPVMEVVSTSRQERYYLRVKCSIA